MTIPAVPEATARVVTSVEEWTSALGNPSVQAIVVRGQLSNVPTSRLAPGQSLAGEDASCAVSFAPDKDGLQLSADNTVRGLGLHASAAQRAIFNDCNVSDLGRISIAGVTTTGQVQILARGAVRSGHVEVDGLDIVEADASARTDMPKGYGVSVLQGAFTLWNMQPDAASVVTANLTGLSAGRPGAPVVGGGIFVAGGGGSGGGLVAPLLETGAIYSDGGIAPGSADRITGAVFTGFGARVEAVRNLGPVMTHGVNDMVLDNWGTVAFWTAEDKLVSLAPSGIGFVNFGTINELKVLAPIETFGQGARGFNVYAGTVGIAEFDRITTHGDGAIGVQISKPIGKLVVHHGIETFGGTGESLVKGVITTLAAIGLSIKPGGAAQEIDINGGLTVHGDGVPALELLGPVWALRIDGRLVGASEGGANA